MVLLVKKYKQFKSKLLFFSLLILCLSLTGCSGDSGYDAQGYDDSDTCSEYLEQIEELESENQELKQRLDEIQSMSSDRDYNYSDLLDDIESESSY